MLEVIATSVLDAVHAQQGGADRIELISYFEVGGLTPPMNLVREVIGAVKLPVRVMLRETEDFNVTDTSEQQRLCETARQLATLPLDGIVCGFLLGNAIDHGLLARVLEAARPLRVTFHRAFEELSHPLATIEELKRYPQIDTILTSGGKGSQAEKIACLGACERAATPEITILAGGGMTAETIRAIRTQTQIKAFHVGTMVREPASVQGQVAIKKVQQVISAVLS